MNLEDFVRDTLVQIVNGSLRQHRPQPELARE
jgi:hypothetical protein